MRPVAVLLLASVIFTAGCQTPPMPVPSELAGAMPLPVSGRYRSFGRTQISFGTWSTARTHEGLVWGFGQRVLGQGTSSEVQPYEIVLSSGTRTLQAECYAQAFGVAGGSLTLQPPSSVAPLACAFTGAGEGTLRLQVSTSGSRGDISFQDSEWTVRSVQPSPASPTLSDEPLGYEISRNGKAIAAIQTAEPSNVWLGPELSGAEQDRAALVLTALLLYQPTELEPDESAALR